MSCCGGRACRRWCYDRSAFVGDDAIDALHEPVDIDAVEDYSRPRRRPTLTVEDYGQPDEIDQIVYGPGSAPRPRSVVIDGQPYHLVPSMIPVEKKPWWKRLFGLS